MTDFPREPFLEDEEPSEDELEQAAQLARALDREAVGEAQLNELLPALEAAHLLQAFHAPDLSAERLDALFESLEASLPATPAAARPSASPWRGLRALLVLLSGAGATAALALWLMARAPSPADTVASLPPPTLELLAAQTAAVGGHPAEARGEGAEGDGVLGGTRDSELARAMRPYRAELLAQLEQEYAP